MVKEKLCPKCDKVKIAEEFSKSKSTKTGLKCYCKECASKDRKKYYHKNIDKEKKYREENKEKKKKYFKEYYKDNKEIMMEQRKKYYYDNHKYYLEKNKKWREENPERMAEYKRKWENENRERLRERRNKFNKENPHISAWRSLVRNTIKRLNTDKEKSTIEELGYSAEDLKLNMISKFTEGMSWDNYGGHIDHIKSVKSFDKNASIKEVNSLTNLQPLWATTREINGVVYEGNLNKGWK